MADNSNHTRIFEICSDPSFKALLHIINDSTIENGNSYPVLSDTVEFMAINRLSRKHAMDYYLQKYFQQNPHFLSQDQLQQLRERLTRQAVRSLNQLNELILICKSLNNKNIPYTIIKGPHLARMLYGNESVKVSADLDILMANPNDLSDFHRILVDLDYACSIKNLLAGSWKQKLYIAAKREVHYFNPSARCTVDLHVKPLANTIITQHRCRDFFSDIQHLPFEGINVPVLPPEKYFVYLCHHGACHQFSRLGWLLDIRNFYDQQKEIMVMDKILSVADSIKAERSVYLAFYLLEGLFHVPMPEKIKQAVDKSGSIEWLAVNCLKAISQEKNDSLTIKARLDRIFYLMRLARGFAGKVDVVLSVFLRYLVKYLFGSKD